MEKKNMFLLILFIVLLLIVVSTISWLNSKIEKDCLNYDTQHSKGVYNASIVPHCDVYDETYGKMSVTDFEKIYVGK